VVTFPGHGQEDPVVPLIDHRTSIPNGGATTCVLMATLLQKRRRVAASGLIRDCCEGFDD
jgi:hypothetical protein